MQVSKEPLKMPTVELEAIETLESDSSPAFIIEVGVAALQFDLLFTNKVLRNTDLRDMILENSSEALRFRSWAQALGRASEVSYVFAGWSWSAVLSSRGGALKLVSGTSPTTSASTIVQNHRGTASAAKNDGSYSKSRSTIHTQSKEDFMKDLSTNRSLLLQNLPRTNLSAQWEGIQTMLEMSDVGIFEYNTEGRLMHANEAWYRQSSYPRDLPKHERLKFMDLIHEDDRDLIMSMWNTLTQGCPVTFEMRWKLRNDDPSEAGKWALTSCIPIFDDDKALISIAGNAIDIDDQKKSQEATQARLEALEQARLSELKFARFAKLSPVAIYIFVPERGMQFVNDQFYELTGHAHTPYNQVDWFNLIAQEDLRKVENDWDGMLCGKRSDGIQFRLKKTWVNQNGVRDNIWVQSSSYPNVDDDGKVLSIMGTLFDISQFKWAEDRAEEALAAKRQQENFIDMTSHELRNPLSAVIQCAESAIASVEHLRAQGVGSRDIEQEIDSTIESLQTIVTCSLHQKRVIDDVLTLSKLDSELILITPVKVQPTCVILKAMKMFDVECRQMDMKLEFREDKSVKEIDWVMLDPSRLLQVLINLLTNAIKFTKGRPVRRITVEFGSSCMRPPEVWEAVSLRTDDQLRTNILEQPEWGIGSKVYLWIKVKDTGCGMTEAEQTKLFSRFTQATPRTHVKYGGSGLGLFISKTLATMQGGAIGVSSEKNVGSTFAFFVSCRVTEAPANQKTGHNSQLRPIPSRRGASFEEAMKAVKLSVLIVEDNLVNQKVLKKQLQKFGWTVYVAGDGEEALQWLRRSSYWRGKESAETIVDKDLKERPRTETAYHDGDELDLILLDIEMPVLDGLTCASRIREWEDQSLLGPPRPGIKTQRSQSTTSLSPITSSQDCTTPRRFRIPILAVSANARMEQIQEALNAGMDDAITKPFRIPELWPKVQGLVPRLSGL
ncbi:hypothetical protein BDU57DRAFT_356309 [Ampelomyces quisqualis]|uniref:Histidine kinase HHK8p n=1 Tax=Ampelomyces quisqualis TaxID=50730 RepID=A0A6A5QCX9_AMPQU|nr:hypothetical protein BDU57DRAFT_356309 [Ampelomyces quisqualis]